MNILKFTNFFYNNTIVKNKDIDVAVIGSSNRLLNNNYGDFIDQHDIIIRFNRAETSGFEKHCGCKTDIRFINSHMIRDSYNNVTANENKKFFEKYDEKFLFKIKNQHVIIYADPLLIKKDIADKIRNNNNKIDIINPDLLSRTRNILGCDSTSGFMGIIMGIHHYGKINIFGWNMENDNMSNHYFEQVKEYVGIHKLSKEKEYIQKWEKEGLLKIFN